MPSITLQHADGTVRRCDSSDPDVIMPWLLEQARAICHGGSAYQTWLQVHPMYTTPPGGGQAVADWPDGMLSVQLEPERINALAQWLRAEIHDQGAAADEAAAKHTRAADRLEQARDAVHGSPEPDEPAGGQ